MPNGRRIVPVTDQGFAHSRSTERILTRRCPEQALDQAATDRRWDMFTKLYLPSVTVTCTIRTQENYCSVMDHLQRALKIHLFKQAFK